MKKLVLSTVCLFLIFTYVSAQYKLVGTVVDGQTERPLAGASVFINGGSKGTVTDKDGAFSINDISLNNFELIISFVSYETLIIKISPDNIGKRFRIQMAPRQNELKEVVIGPVEKDGWKTWGKVFTDNFLGTSNNAKQCVIKNPDVLRFRYNKKTSVLRVSSVDKMIIRNNALGYNVNYQLEEFVYDSRKRMISFIGYSSFETMKGTQRKMRVWTANRKDAFNGSLMHFMRSFYVNDVIGQGFEMRSLIRLFKKDTATLEYYNRIMAGNYSDVDTSKYFIQVMKPDGGLGASIIYLLGKKPLLLKEIRVTDSLQNVYASFPNAIQLVYTKELEKQEYVTEMSGRKVRGPQASIIYLTNNRPINVDRSGLFFEPLDLFTEGYLAWEKMGETLPTDYEVQ